MNEPSDVLETERLRLLPSDERHTHELRRGVAEFKARFGLSVALGLADFLPPEGNDATVAAEWDGFMIVPRHEGMLIGFCASRKFPDAEGAVEIAYGIAPGFQGQGLATEATRALAERALRRSEVRAVTANTRPELNASTRVLTKCGFKRTGEVMDSDVGRAWRWELSRQPFGDEVEREA